MIKKPNDFEYKHFNTYSEFSEFILKNRHLGVIRYWKNNNPPLYTVVLYTGGDSNS
jgi:hypothetical protein